MLHSRRLYLVGSHKHSSTILWSYFLSKQLQLWISYSVVSSCEKYGMGTRLLGLHHLDVRSEIFSLYMNTGNALNWRRYSRTTRCIGKIPSFPSSDPQVSPPFLHSTLIFGTMCPELRALTSTSYTCRYCYR